MEGETCAQVEILAVVHILQQPEWHEVGLVLEGCEIIIIVRKRLFAPELPKFSRF